MIRTGDVPVRIEGLDEAQVAALLAERQARYARPDESTDRATMRLILWSIGAARFALPLADVAAVAPMPRVTRVPGAPSPLVGVFARAGILHNLFDPASLLGATPTGEGDRMVLVLRHDRCLALAIDRAEGIADIAVALATHGSLTHFIAGDGELGYTLVSLPHLARHLLGEAGRLEG